MKVDIDFLDEMKKKRNRMILNEGMASIIENDDFDKLVKMAERAAQLEQGFKEHYRNICRIENSKPYDIYDPTEAQTLERAARFLDLE